MVQVFQGEDRGHLLSVTGILSPAVFIDRKSFHMYGCMDDYVVFSMVVCACACLQDFVVSL